MPGKTLKTRIQNKVDSLANLQTNNPYILAGELVTAYTTVGVKQESGDVVQKRVAYIYVGPGNFNDLYPIVGPSAVPLSAPWNVDATTVPSSLMANKSL